MTDQIVNRLHKLMSLRATCWTIATPASSSTASIRARHVGINQIIAAQLFSAKALVHVWRRSNDYESTARSVCREEKKELVASHVCGRSPFTAYMESSLRTYRCFEKSSQRHFCLQATNIRLGGYSVSVDASSKDEMTS